MIDGNFVVICVWFVYQLEKQNSLNFFWKYHLMPINIGAIFSKIFVIACNGFIFPI